MATAATMPRLRERYLREVVPLSKVQGKPFKVSEIYDGIMELC